VIVDGVSNANDVWVPVRSVSRLPGVALSTPVERYCFSAPIAVKTPSASMKMSGASITRGRLKKVSSRLTTIRWVRPRSSGAGSAGERVVDRTTGCGGFAAGYMRGRLPVGWIDGRVIPRSVQTSASVHFRAMSSRLFRSGGLLVRAVVASPTAYLGLLTFTSRRELRRRAVRPPSRETPAHRVAILVPAHNEEQLIGSTLHSLAALDYPADRFSVHVVADNCTDRTVERARAAGADVHERRDLDDPGKGPALQWLMTRLWSRGDQPDAVMFLDADTTIDRGFLRAVDRHLAAGADVVQGHYSVRGADDAPTVAFRAAALAARTFLRPLGRVALGGSAGLHGNGMVFRRAVMERPRSSNHLTEDVELALDLLLDGVKVAFAEDAQIAAEMPTTLDASRTQHERWERGRILTAKAYVPRLVRRSVMGGPAGRVAYADAVFDQVVPPFSIVVASSALWMVVASVGVIFKPRSRRRRRDAAAAAATMATQAWFVYSALRMTHAPKSVYRSLLGAPRQVAWKIGLWLRVVRRPDRVSWTRTARNENVAGTS
jgi:hypothetical protein